jgi:hypothetical protein
VIASSACLCRLSLVTRAHNVLFSAAGAVLLSVSTLSGDPSSQHSAGCCRSSMQFPGQLGAQR